MFIRAESARNAILSREMHHISLQFLEYIES